MDTRARGRGPIMRRRRRRRRRKGDGGRNRKVVTPLRRSDDNTSTLKISLQEGGILVGGNAGGCERGEIDKRRGKLGKGWIRPSVAVFCKIQEVLGGRRGGRGWEMKSEDRDSLAGRVCAGEKKRERKKNFSAQVSL